ncbi:unnamed protein product [Prorocentrum cordatum]|uniref:WW domain-containing protein n=2 Tax=Prorocentrum cordatum TaxID=2364126 RepID=A0ABN9PBZ0_9DINO|nr:unnamed protein product [Polarella glacialis]
MLRAGSITPTMPQASVTGWGIASPRSGGETSWEPPAPPLAEGWAAMVDAEGRTYYGNAATGETSWEPPVAASAEAGHVAPQAEQDAWDEQIVKAVERWFMETEMERLFFDATAFADQHCEAGAEPLLMPQPLEPPRGCPSPYRRAVLAVSILE